MLNRTKFLLPDEWERTLNLLIKQRPNNKAMAIEFAMRTGARSCEILQVRKSDLFDESNSVLIRGAKGSNDRELPLDPVFYQVLKAYSQSPDHALWAKPGQAHRLFPFGYRVFMTGWEFYRPCKKGLHSLRHTFAMELFKKHRDLRLVQVALGHKAISSTMIYANYLYSTDELRKAMFPDKLHPYHKPLPQTDQDPRMLQNLQSIDPLALYRK